jgi:hypothetical protein
LFATHTRPSLIIQIVMSTPNENSNTQFQPPSSQASVEGGSGLPENVINVEQDGDEDDDEVEENGRKRKLKSAVWSEFKRVKVGDVWKAKCNYCSKKLSGVTKNGTSHLKAHLETCIYRKRNPTDKVQSSLRFTSSSEQGQVSVEKYVFDQDVARKALAEMVVLHEYPLSIVDHVGFRRYSSALQPMFKMITRNTLKNDIIGIYEIEKKKALSFMQKNNARIAITTDMWTAENQKKGYMTVTGHFIDQGWQLRSCILRYLAVL